MAYVDVEGVEKAVVALLRAIGEDDQREGLIDTPSRVARFWRDFLEYKSGKLDTSFSRIEVDQLVIVRHIPFYSMCEHHLLPFVGTATVGYLTYDRVIGLSKIPRVVLKHAHRLQLQERLTNDIAVEVQQLTGADDVACYVVAEHFCVKMRGVETDAEMVTSAMFGRFRDVPELRSEFLNLAV